jgi:hypothetical protein
MSGVCQRRRTVGVMALTRTLVSGASSLAIGARKHDGLSVEPLQQQRQHNWLLAQGHSNWMLACTHLHARALAQSFGASGPFLISGVSVPFMFYTIASRTDAILHGSLHGVAQFYTVAFWTGVVNGSNRCRKWFNGKQPIHSSQLLR